MPASANVIVVVLRSVLTQHIIVPPVICGEKISRFSVFMMTEVCVCPVFTS